MGEGRRVVAYVVAALSLGAVLASTLGAAASPATVPQATHAVGVVTETLVDPHRATPAWDNQPEHSGRTLITTIYYPALGAASSAIPQPNAPPAAKAGGYPLIVFSHGLGADPLEYQSLLSYWASAGFVVAAPQFPLSSDHTAGGPDEGDIANQPGDVSFVITSVLGESTQSGGVLSGLVNAHEVGAAGHSNGALTTLALVADTCCLDHRVKAAVVMAGDEVSFPGGHYDFAQAPPLLLVHGTADQLLPYSGAVAIFNNARGPKGLLTINGGDHEAAAGFSAPSAVSVQRATTDFFSAYLSGDKSVLADLSSDAAPGVTKVTFTPQAGSKATITTVPPPVLHLRATATPTTNLTNGEAVTVRWSGYSAGKVVNVLECNAQDAKLNNSSACSFTYAKVLTPDPTGQGTLAFRVVTGTVGNGVCDAAHNGCQIVVNNASSAASSSSVRIPISFAS